MAVGVVDRSILRDLEDEVLATRVNEDFDAFAELYDRYLCRVYRFVRSQTSDDATAEDLTAQTFFRALSSAHSFDGRGSYRAWIFRIAHNAIVTWRTTRMKAPVVVELLPEEADPSPSPAAMAVSGEQQRLVRHLIGSLPPAQREVLSLRYLEDLEIEEIARATGRSRGAVRILLHRARAALRRAIENGALG